MRWLVLGAAMLFAVGCDTNIRIKNSLPGSTLKDARWVSEVTGEAYRSDGDPLRSGETSASIGIYEPSDEGARGKIHFELVVDGKRVALVTKRSFKSRQGETKTFAIKPGTEVENPVLEALGE